MPTLLSSLLLLSVAAGVAGADRETAIRKFVFADRAPGGAILVKPGMTYSGAAGYGFEPGSELQAERAVTSDRPFFFSVAVAEGNYRVRVALGGSAHPSVTTVKAELRRLAVERCATAEKQIVTRSFIVNVRRPEIPGGERVHFKDREKTSEAWAWDDKLTLEFSGDAPSVSSVSVEKVEAPTVFIAGDSTSTDQAREPFNSWGQMITGFFNPEVAVSNHGESGESADSFVRENRWAKLMSVLKPRDTILIQFGHNDQKDKREGAGAFSTYKTALQTFVEQVRKRGAIAVLVTPMHRRTFDSTGRITNSLGDFPAAVRQLAKEQNVPLVDLNELSKTLYEALGPETSGLLFAGKDTTHHSDYGSYELAKCMAIGLTKAHVPVARQLRKDVLAFDPAHPDPPGEFKLPPDPDATSVKPYGN